MSSKSDKKHVPVSKETSERLNEEYEKVKSYDDATTVIFLTNQGFRCLAMHYTPVTCIEDLEALPKRLIGDREIAFSPFFDPKLVDACMLRGIFPLTLCLQDDIFLFAPKLHSERLICATVENSQERNEIQHFPLCQDNEGIFTVDRLDISKRFLKPSDDTSGQTCFDAFVNRKEDLVDVFGLIHQQHGENWLCKSLRKCLFYMQSHEKDFKSKIITIAVRRHQYTKSRNMSSFSIPDEVKEGDLVAAEIGYVVGDIYTSATGAFCVSGAGKLQLAVTGSILRDLGFKIWDLGMPMTYKSTMLGCLTIERDPWMQMVKEHRQHNVLGEEKSKDFFFSLQRGKSVYEILKHTPKSSRVNTSSKCKS